MIIGCGALSDNEEQRHQLNGNSPIGITGDKILLTLMGTYSWKMAIDMCMGRGFVPATISNANEHSLILDYQRRNPDGQIPPLTFWLPATDFGSEGNYRWMSRRPMEFSNWTTGQPTVNRSLNCAIINEDGSWSEERCGKYDGRHYALCEVKLLVSRIYNSKTMDAMSAPFKDETLNVNTTKQDPAVTLIGSVGEKFFFRDNSNTERGWTESMNFCHELGMQMISVSNQEEIDFLALYAEEDSNGGPSSSFVTAGTDINTENCTNAVTTFRWFHSGEVVTVFNRTNWGTTTHYSVIRVGPRGLTYSDLIGELGFTICQLGDGGMLKDEFCH